MQTSQVEMLEEEDISKEQDEKDEDLRENG